MHAPANIPLGEAYSPTMSAPIYPNEAQRLEALRTLNLLDTPPEERFDRITRLAARVLSVPMAAVVLVDEHRAYFKSHYGCEMSEIPRNGSFCAYNLTENKQMVVPDAHADPRFADNPF